MKKIIFILSIIIFSLSIVYADSCQIIKGNGLSIGDEIKCAEELFYVIGIEDTNIKMLSKYNLSSEYKQTQEINEVSFANKCDWPYRPGPFEVDIQLYDGNAKEYIKNYKEYLQTNFNDSSINVDLATLKDLKNLECTTTDDYTYNADLTCINSQYANWLVNGQWWWLKSAFATEHERVFIISDAGKISYGGGCYFANGIRPVITISSTHFEKKEITTKTDGNGTIEIVEDSRPGEKVTYTITPKEGYTIKEIKLTDEQGKVTIVKENEFIMPSSDITIEVIFDKIVENPNTISISVIASLLFASISVIIITINYKKIKWINE